MGGVQANIGWALMILGPSGWVGAEGIVGRAARPKIVPCQSVLSKSLFFAHETRPNGGSQKHGMKGAIVQDANAPKPRRCEALFGRPALPSASVINPNKLIGERNSLLADGIERIGCTT